MLILEATGGWPVSEAGLQTVGWAEWAEEQRQAPAASAHPARRAGQVAPDAFHLPLVGPGLAA